MNIHFTACTCWIPSPLDYVFDLYCCNLPQGCVQGVLDCYPQQIGQIAVCVLNLCNVEPRLFTPMNAMLRTANATAGGSISHSFVGDTQLCARWHGTTHACTLLNSCSAVLRVFRSGLKQPCSTVHKVLKSMLHRSMGRGYRHAALSAFV